MKPSYDDLALFIQIVRVRSLQGAADYLGLPAATVTRRLKRLESCLGYQLIRRSARHFSLTGEGEVYYESYAGLIDELDQVTSQLSRDSQEMSGPLRVSAPTNLATGLLGPMWTRFMKAYPAIRLELMLSNRTEDLLQQRIDIALRIGPQTSSGLYQKKLGWVRTRLVASPEYLRLAGEPETLEDLHQHRLAVFKLIDRWALQHQPSGRRASLRPTPSTILDDLTMVKQFVCDGLGISLLPANEIQQPLQDGRLQLVLPDWTGPEREIFAVWPDGRLLNRRARCLRDFMQDYIGEEPVLQGL